MRELPPDHHFPDGDLIHYWRDSRDPDVIWCQLLNKNWRPKSAPQHFKGDQNERSKD